MIGTGWSQQTGQSETLGFNAATTGTTTVTYGASNAKGAWSSIGGVTSFDYNLIEVHGYTNQSPADSFFDVGITVGANTFVIAGDIWINTSGEYGSTNVALSIQIPLFIKAGAQLAMRGAKANINTFQWAHTITGYSNGVGGQRGFSRCRALYTPASSVPPLVDSGATANTKGAYTQLVASSGFTAVALMAGIGTVSIDPVAASRMAMDLSIGGSGSEWPFFSNFVMCMGPGGDNQMLTASYPILPVYVPSGSRIAVRGQSNSTVAAERNFRVGLWGFEP